MVAGLILLLYYLVEIEKRFTRLGAYPFALLILIHQMEYTIYYQAWNFFLYVKSQAAYWEATQAASRILLFHGVLTILLAFLIPILRDKYFKYGNPPARGSTFVYWLIFISYLVLGFVIIGWAASPVLA
jgi:hypothetical protein